MEEANITRALRILKASGTAILEWNFKQKKLLLCPGFFSLLNETVEQGHKNLRFLLKRLHKDDRRLLLLSFQQQIEKFTPIDLEVRLQKNDGTHIWVRAQGKTQRDENNNPTILTLVLSDITKQHKISEELKLSEERLRHASECANISLWEIDSDYRGKEVNRKFWWSDSLYSLLGYQQEELRMCQEDIYRIMHPEDLGRVRQEVHSVIDNDSEVIDIKFRLMHKTDGYIWLRCNGHREKLGEGLYKALGAVININGLELAQQEAKNKNEKLEQTNEELEHFAYAASHDLKAPLRGLKNLSNWIREDINNPPESINQNLCLMHNRIERMETLLTDILAYSRAGRRNKEPEDIDLRSLIDEIWDCARPPSGFSLNLQLDRPSITESRTLLEQTFSNLISNSIKHHDKAEGEIAISYSVNDAQHHFSVIDDGPGIAPQFQHKVFQIFQTLRPRDEVEGSGVGLAIVKRNIVSSGGAVWLDSLQEQRGACFNFTLPRRKSRIAQERKSLGLFDNAP